MRNVKVWVLAAVVVAALCGTALLVDHSSSSSAIAQDRPAEHWRWHDGRWSYWHPGDNRWYYTDGTHWYYNEGDHWNVYRFDRQFGRRGFERGAYQVPAEGEKIAVPRHGVFRR